jgi:hypothetical protein
MDLASIDEDPAAALAAVEADAASSVSDQQYIFTTPDRKHPLSSPSSKSTTPGYFSYGSIDSNYRNEFRDRYHDDQDIPGLRTPSLLSSPSVASSLGFSTGRVSPQKREQSNHSRISSINDSSRNSSPSVRRNNRPRNSRDVLAQRLSQLAHELTTGEDDLLDDSGVDILTAQLDQLEGTKMLEKTVSFSVPSTPSPRPNIRRPVSLDMYSPGESIFSTPGSAFKTRFSDLGASIRRDPAPEPTPEPDPPPNLGMTVAQAKKVIQEVTQLNEEMSQLVENLKARQEESDVCRNSHLYPSNYLQFCSISKAFLLSAPSVLLSALSFSRTAYLISSKNCARMMMNYSIFAFVSRLSRFKCPHTPTKNSKDAYPHSRKITKPSNENVSTAPVSPVYPVSVRHILDHQHDIGFLFPGQNSSNAQRRLYDSRRT